MFSATKKSQKSSAQKSSGFGHFLDASRGELHSRKYFNTYHLFLQAGCLRAEAKILSLHSASKQSFSKPFPLWSYALHTAGTFFSQESTQRFTKNLLVFGFPAEGGTPPSIPHEHLPICKEGERDRLREGMVLVRKANWFCFPSPENRILFDFHGDGASF